ncbi:MAG: Veg family protein [Clostridia bacterium]|nr:Veg family protein [Clostridia bacterium]
MIKSSGNIVAVKNEIKNFLNSDVDVKVNLGRNKFVTYKGKLTNVYPALFTVSPYGDFSGKTSFSYSEVMCGAVTVQKSS